MANPSPTGLLSRQAPPPTSAEPVAAVSGDLAILGPIDFVLVTTAADRNTFHQFMAQHPLVHKPLCGPTVLSSPIDSKRGTCAHSGGGCG